MRQVVVGSFDHEKTTRTMLQFELYIFFSLFDSKTFFPFAVVDYKSHAVFLVEITEDAYFEMHY